MTDPQNPETPPEEPTGQEPGPEEPPVEEPTLEEEPQVEEPPEPQEPEESLEDKILHKMQSWYGRREQALMDRIQQMVPQGQQEQAYEQNAPDPSSDADAWLEYKLSKKAATEQKYVQNLYQSGMQYIAQDPAVQADNTLQEEILQEVNSGRVPVNRQMDPQSAAQQAVLIAKANVLTRRMTQPKNPLQNNQPSNTPRGGVKPPEPKGKKPPKVENLSSLTKQKARQWGYSDEELAKIFGKA